MAVMAPYPFGTTDARRAVRQQSPHRYLAPPPSRTVEPVERSAADAPRSSCRSRVWMTTSLCPTRPQEAAATPTPMAMNSQPVVSSQRWRTLGPGEEDPQPGGDDDKGEPVDDADQDVEDAEEEDLSRGRVTTVHELRQDAEEEERRRGVEHVGEEALCSNFRRWPRGRPSTLSRLRTQGRTGVAGLAPELFHSCQTFEPIAVAGVDQPGMAARPGDGTHVPHGTRPRTRLPPGPRPTPHRLRAYPSRRRRTGPRGRRGQPAALHGRALRIAAAPPGRASSAGRWPPHLAPTGLPSAEAVTGRPARPRSAPCGRAGRRRAPGG